MKQRIEELEEELFSFKANMQQIKQTIMKEIIIDLNNGTIR